MLYALGSPQRACAYLIKGGILDVLLVRVAGVSFG